ncbi:MAG: PhnA domain-containing protein [Bacteroidia bacterium]
MTIQETVQQRSSGVCELCSNTSPSQVYAVKPQDYPTIDNSLFICQKCVNQIDKKEALEASHWAGLSSTMWSEVIGVQVMAWRMLNRLRRETWAADNLELLYLSEEDLAWAKAMGDQESDVEVDLHRDCNSIQLHEGDTVVLMKSLEVKGSPIQAKMGTVVKNIRLVAENIEQIEGKIEGQLIVILAKFVRKQGA